MIKGVNEAIAIAKEEGLTVAGTIEGKRHTLVCVLNDQGVEYRHPVSRAARHPSVRDVLNMRANFRRLARNQTHHLRTHAPAQFA